MSSKTESIDKLFFMLGECGVLSYLSTEALKQSIISDTMHIINEMEFYNFEQLAEYSTNNRLLFKSIHNYFKNKNLYPDGQDGEEISLKPVI